MPGVYVMCAVNIKNLPVEMQGLKYKFLGKKAVIYVGKSEKSLLPRYDTHFRGTARWSTFRKSIGVLFGLRKEILDKGKYKFTSEDEKWLSQWLSENIILYYLECKEIKEIEQEFIDHFLSPLNLKGNKQLINVDFRKKLTGLRK
jgi:hypothetical protein